MSKQLKNLREKEVWAWGSDDFVCYDKKIGEFEMPTLAFNITTPKVPTGGKIEISLNEGEDLYVIEASQVEKLHRTQLGIVHGVYTDCLHDTINRLIEDKETINTIFF